VVHPLLRKILDPPLILQRIVFHSGAAPDSIVKIVKLGVIYFYELATDSYETSHIN